MNRPESQWNLHKPPVICVACAAPLHLHAGAADAYPVCHAVACRMVVSRRAEMDDIAFGHYLRRHVQQQREHRAREAANSARKATETAENARTWVALQAHARLPTEATAAPLQLLLPSGPRRARPIALVRRARYRAHLTAIVAFAAAMAPGSAAACTDQASTMPSAMPGRLCGLCGGGCCTRGSDHAYLSPPILRRFMDAHPTLSNEEVVTAYVERINRTSQAGSCINHTRAGCSLPREMRSDICNAYACEALAQLQATQAGSQRVHIVLVVRRKQDQWHRYQPGLDNAINGAAVLGETGARRMPLG